MIREVILPQLSMGMSEGSISEWLAKEGVRIERDQPLAMIENEKTVTDLPAPYTGFLHIIVNSGGDKIPVESLIAKIADTEAEYRSIAAGAGAPSVAVAAPVKAAVSVSAPQAAADASGNEAGGRRIRVSGLAKKIAKDKGISLQTVTGTGPAGRIVRRDVLEALQTKPAAAAPAGARTIATGHMAEKARIPLTGMRATIAERMVKAKTTAAQTYAFFEIDVTKLVAMRETLLGREKELGTRISATAIYARAVALACQEVPICNATLIDREIIVWENVNIGIAVALPGKGEYDSGLVVPVVRDVQAKGLLAIDRDIREVVDRARSGTMKPQDMADSTITISSSAGFLPGAWMVSTPLLNLPNVVNFQPGSTIQKPLVIDGKVEVRTVLPCGLTFDHRAMDGEPVARFIRKISDLLANPELMLL